MKKETRIKFKEVQERYDTLEIGIRHNKAGYGGFDWTYRPAGMQIVFTPCLITEGCRESTLMSGNQWTSGFFLPLNDMARSNPHWIRRALVAVDEAKEALRDAYEAHDAERLKVLAVAIDEKAAKK